jgi:hypothetical protein
MERPQPLTWVLIGVSCAAVAFAGYRFWRLWELVSITGAVLRQDPDPGRQIPIRNVQVTLRDDLARQPAASNASGLFKLNLREAILRGRSVTIELRHADYQPLIVSEPIANHLYVFRMTPIHQSAQASGPPVTITDVRVRFAVKNPNTTNVGSAVKVFDIVNQGNVPCNRHSPCSPDGRWKAAIGGASLDAGAGNVFKDARVTCIAGPCPFTRIDKDSYSEGGRVIGVRVRNWSDTTTFVLEAEVIRSGVVDMVLQTFPVILTQALSFTLPPSAQGPSIEATVDGQDIVYPLGPTLQLSWADCNLQVVPGASKLYRCVVKPGYQVH